jgi:hypothetical protein
MRLALLTTIGAILAFISIPLTNGAPIEVRTSKENVAVNVRIVYYPGNASFNDAGNISRRVSRIVWADRLTDRFKGSQSGRVVGWADLHLFI